MQPAGEDQKIDFSNVVEISAYVPQIRIRFFPYPLLACDIDDIPETLIGWSDTHNDHDIHNLIYDIPYEGSKRAKRTPSPTKAPASDSEHEDQGDKAAAANEEEATQDATADPTNDIPKWPIYSIVKYYPRTFSSPSRSST